MMGHEFKGITAEDMAKDTMRPDPDRIHQAGPPQKQEGPFPLYKMVVDGKEQWLSIREAGIVYDSGWTPVAIGGLVLEAAGVPREITEEEKQRISNIADEWSASK